MKVMELRELTRKETGIYYRREFRGQAVLESLGELSELPLSFIIENQPVGPPEISFAFDTEPTWPIVPVISSLKHLVREMDKTGLLP
ncbi:MAG: hypothetical protein WCQ50_01640 [Spirochaetota bacterium]